MITLKYLTNYPQLSGTVRIAVNCEWDKSLKANPKMANNHPTDNGNRQTRQLRSWPTFCDTRIRVMVG